MKQNLRKNIVSSYNDALYFSLMVGAGETYLAAFVLSQGYSDLLAGWITSFPLIAGGILQMVSPAMVNRMGSIKRWVVFTAFAQALVLFALAIQAQIGFNSYVLIFILASLYWGSGMANGPAWNAWMGSLIPFNMRTSFFSVRNMISHASVLGGILLGGWCLHMGESGDNTHRFSFLILFGGAGICRLISTYFLYRQSEANISGIRDDKIPDQKSLKDWFRIFKQWQGQEVGKLLVFMFVLGIGVHFGAGFFTPYMLNKIKMSYNEYAIMLGTALIARVFTLFFLKHYLSKWRSERVLLVSVLGIVPLPILWNLSHDFYYLLSLQFLSGAAWGTYELVTFLFIFNGIPFQDKTSLLSLFNLLQTIAILIGASVGGWYLFSQDQTWIAYESLFNWSSLLRLGALAFFPGVILAKVPLRLWIIARPLAVRPGSGTLSRPIVASMKEPEPQKGGRNPQ